MCVGLFIKLETLRFGKCQAHILALWLGRHKNIDIPHTGVALFLLQEDEIKQ